MLQHASQRGLVFTVALTAQLICGRRPDDRLSADTSSGLRLQSSSSITKSRVMEQHGGHDPDAAKLPHTTFYFTQLLYSLKEFVQSEEMHEDGAEPMFV